jgi:type I restriction enzyme S subunit
MIFYKETEFKEVEIGKIPTDWKISEVGELFEVVTGTTPSTKDTDYWNGGNINWFTPLDLSKLNGRISIKESERKITAKALKEYNLTLMPPGSIILSTRAPVGYVAVLEREGTFNQGCKGLIPKDKENVHSLFYSYYLLSQKQELENLSSGSTFKELSKTMLENFKIPLPHIEEQRAVAGVLGVVDSVIAKTDEVIAKTERLKKGLMQTLLTRGIGHKEFKETEIGKIPKTWQIAKIEDVAKRVSDIISAEELSKTQREYVLYSIPAYHEIGKPELTYSGKIRSAKFRVIKGDILFGKINPKIPKVWMVEHSDALASTEFIVLRADENKVTSRFLYYLLQLDRILKLSILSAKGAVTSRLRTDVESFMHILIQLPHLFEQQKIADILSTIDKKLEFERNAKARLERIKRGLMDLLLTGKVRVKVE